MIRALLDKAAPQVEQNVALDSVIGALHAGHTRGRYVPQVEQYTASASGRSPQVGHSGCVIRYARTRASMGSIAGWGVCDARRRS